jgi:16S rRNA C1402 N4-methylase RsmH
LKVLGTDLDETLLGYCKLEYADLIKSRRLALEHSNFVNIPAIDLKKAFNRKITVKAQFDIGLLDLGFSNFQVMDEERGFSYLP